MHNRETVWYTNDGERLILKNIETSHLRNIINMINKNKSKFNSDTVKNFNKELKLRNKELRVKKLNNIENNPDYKDLF